MSATNRARISLIVSMVIFGTIGLVRSRIPLPPAVIALVRAAIGGLCLFLFSLIRGKRVNFAALKKVWPWLILSGAALGFNWILLFEAYDHTTVAVATVCYYCAPIFVLLMTPLLFKTRLTARQIVCVAVALIGMLGVAGLFSGEDKRMSPLGILFGLGAAVLYAAVMLIGRKLAAVDAIDKTLSQLWIAAAVLLPYCCFTGFGDTLPTPTAWVWLIVAGVVHTGVAYLLYFGAMGHLPPPTVAVLSYIDPVVAVVLSALLLSQPMDVFGVVGTAHVLVASYLLERK